MQIKKIFNREFRIFTRKDFHSKDHLLEGIRIFLSWAIPAFIFVAWVNRFEPENVFYQKAITEGIGPNLWNVMGSFGCIAFGVSLFFPSCKKLTLIGRHILSNTYSMGCLTFGLLFGQWCYIPLDNLVWWQQGLFGIVSVLLLGVVVALNYLIWYLYFLLQENEFEPNFLSKVSNMRRIARCVIGGCVSTIFLGAFVFA